MKKCCFFSKGEIKLRASFDKNVCTSDDQIAASIMLDMTDVKAGSVSRIQVSVNKIVQLSTSNRGMFGGRSGARQFKYPIIRQNLPGLKAGEKSDQAHQMMIDFSKVIDPDIPNQLRPELGQYGDKIQQTVHGNLIQSYYEFEVKAIMNTFCCECCFAQPNVFTTLEITAPNYVMVMVQQVPMMQDAGMDPNLKMSMPAPGVPVGAGPPEEGQPENVQQPAGSIPLQDAIKGGMQRQLSNIKVKNMDNMSEDSEDSKNSEEDEESSD